MRSALLCVLRFMSESCSLHRGAGKEKVAAAEGMVCKRREKMAAAEGMLCKRRAAEELPLAWEQMQKQLVHPE
jgi:hypothetical protein